MENTSGKASVSVEMAPMEGITTATFRRIYRNRFGGTDREYTPFLVANQTHSFKSREKKEYKPHSQNLVPQILTDCAEHFLWAAGELQKAGYEEVNLNAGCPSATVTTKKKGAGMLSDIASFRAFFDEVFAAKETQDLPEISVKTRAGFSSYDETEELAGLYAAYPLSKIIVHPRIRDEFYEGKPNLEAFDVFYERLPHDRLVFNGDLRTVEDVQKIRDRYPDISGVMIGRGLLADPFLPQRINGQAEARGSDFSEGEKEVFLAFLEELYEEYAREVSEGTALLKMKDLWNFMAPSFQEKGKQLKAMRKSRTGQDYRMAVRSLFR